MAAASTSRAPNTPVVCLAGGGVGFYQRNEMTAASSMRLQKQVAVVGEVEEFLARALGRSAGQLRQLVVPVEVHFERLLARRIDLVALHSATFMMSREWNTQDPGRPI